MISVLNEILFKLVSCSTTKTKKQTTITTISKQMKWKQNQEQKAYEFSTIVAKCFSSISLKNNRNLIIIIKQ